MLTLYGIPNCDSCRKGRQWLDGQKIEYQFHDVREDGLKKADIERWLRVVSWNKLLNTRSTTWRQLSPQQRADSSEESVVALLLQHPTLVKRPVLEDKNFILVGFSADQYDEKLG